VNGNGSVVAPGAFTKTLTEAMASKARKQPDSPVVLWPLLWQHQEKEPIGGVAFARQNDYGLAIIGQLEWQFAIAENAASGWTKGRAEITAAFAAADREHKA
jgi:hypothetical protein